MPKQFTEEEDRLIRVAYPKYGAKFVADRLERSVPTIWHRANKLGVSSPSPRPQPDDSVILTEYHLGATHLAMRLGRSKKSIYNRASRLGITDWRSRGRKPRAKVTGE